jgi:hypothetical protein
MEIVDDFEDGDIDEYEPHYSDPSLALATFDVVDGSLAGAGSKMLRAHRPDGSGPNPRIHSTAGLEYYPSRGDTIEFYTQYSHSQHTPRYHFGVQDQEENNLYFVEYDSRADVNPQNPDTLALVRRVDGANTELARVPAPFSNHANEVLRCVIEWAEPIRVAFYDSSDALIAEASASDDTFSDGGIGFRIRGHYRRSDTVYWDQVRATPGGGSPSIGLVWDTTADWDASVGSSGVVHESVTNTDHVDAGVVKQGYSVESPVPSAGLVGYWTFDEDSGTVAYDFSGNGNHGSIEGATLGASGLLGTSAYSFDGIDDRVVLPSGLLSGSSDFSVSLWVRSSDVTDQHDHIIDLRGDLKFTIRLGNDGASYGVWDGTPNVYRNTDATASADTWHHVVLTRDDSTGDVEVYVDGTLEDSATSDTGSKTNSSRPATATSPSTQPTTATVAGPRPTTTRSRAPSNSSRSSAPPTTSRTTATRTTTASRFGAASGFVRTTTATPPTRQGSNQT